MNARGGKGLALLVALFGFVAACDGEARASAEARRTATGARSPVPSFGADLREIAIQGTRRVEVRDTLAVPPRHLVYLEEVVTDGRGSYSIEPLEALTQVAPDWETFRIVQGARQRFIFDYRDFRVRDPDLFEKNYRIVALDERVTIAGREAALYRIEPRVPDRATYVVAADLETDIVLRFVELDPSGALRASVEYVTLVVSHGRALAPLSPSGEEALDLEEDLREQLAEGFLLPKLPPRGYALRAASTVAEEDGTRWLKLTYLDGIEPLFFLCKLKAPVGLQEGGPYASTLQVFRLGAALVAQGTVESYDVIALGKVTEDELLSLIESALPTPR